MINCILIVLFLVLIIYIITGCTNIPKEIVNNEKVVTLNVYANKEGMMARICYPDKNGTATINNETLPFNIGFVSEKDAFIYLNTQLIGEGTIYTSIKINGKTITSGSSNGLFPVSKINCFVE